MEENLKDKTARGLFWGGLSNGVLQLLNLAFGIILARLLSPSDYGMVGMLQVFSLVAIALQESGLNVALINKKDLRHEDINAVFWFSLTVSITLYLILYACAPAIAAFYKQPLLTPLARFTFLSFVISSLGICHNAVLMRELKVKQNAIIMMVSLLVSGTVGVVMAWHGMAYWGLATQSMVYIAGVALGRWMVSGWRPTLFSRYEVRGARYENSEAWYEEHFRGYEGTEVRGCENSNEAQATEPDSNLAPPYPRTPAPPKKLFAPLKTLLPFSLKIMAANLITILNNNILTVLLGRLFNEREVGFYNQASKWNQMGFSVIQGMIVSVAQPVMRQVEDDRERLLRVFRKMLRFSSFVSFPCMFGLALVAPELITIAITDKWLPSARLMQMVCIGGAFLPLHQLMYQLLVSKGRSDVCLWSTIVFGLVQLATVLACSLWGITAMVAAFVAVNILWTLVWWWLIRQQTGLSLWLFLRDLLPFLLIAAACILAAAWAASFVPNVYLSLMVKVVVAVALYLVAMQLLHVETFRESLTYLRKRNKA
ncbi:MAG: lipopolysaccharide biosynthesis protein [Prevotella sp.]|nr:lipopolysaccharide biosynthesis protein [Prevotella sp.]